MILNENLFENVELNEEVNSEDLYFKVLHFIDDLGYDSDIAKEFYQMDDVIDSLTRLLKRVEDYKKYESLKESKNLIEEYKARWDNMATYSNPIKQQYADLVNDQIYDAFDNIDILALSKISDLPEQTDFGFDQAERVSKAIANLVRTMTTEYFRFTDLKDESLEESFTVELYKDRNKDPERKRFKDYESAMKFAKDNTNDFEAIMITKPDASGPSVVNSYEKDSGWYTESLNEVKIADEIKAKQDTKEMTRRAIKMLKNLGGDYEDLAKEFKDAYGEDPLEEAVKLGGGMSLPYDDNYCIFVNLAKKTTYITKVNSKKEFASCENSYGSFVGVEKSLEDAKEYVASFNGPAKDNKVVIDS